MIKLTSYIKVGTDAIFTMLHDWFTFSLFKNS